MNFIDKQRFDVIKYPAYRVASKLRFVQRRTNCKSFTRPDLFFV